MTDFLGHLRREADLLRATVDGADWDAPVPSCPGWVLRDLVLHTGAIHRWALQRATGTRSPRDEPTDAELAAWFADGAQRLHDGLADADPGRPCQGFEDPATVAFWVRRQANETAVHRVDAQLATGADVAPLPPDLALDGVAEVFEVFAPRQVRLGRSDPPPYGLVLLSPDGTVTVPGPDPVTVRASAPDLLLALWRRPAHVTASDPAHWQAVLDSGLTP